MPGDAIPPCTPLGEVVRLSAERVVANKRPDWPYVGLEHMERECPDLVGSAHSGTSSSTNNVFHAGDVLFGKLRPYLRKSVGARSSGYCSTDILVLRPNDTTAPAFAAKVFQSEPVLAEAVASSFGTKMPRTSWTSMRQLAVFFPPRPEQLRIAEILDTLDEVIRRTEHVIAKLHRMKQGLLHDLLTRGINEHGEPRDPDRHPEQFKDSPLGRIPKAWDVACLDEIRHSSTQITYGVLKPGPFTPGGVPLLQIEDVIHGDIDRGKLHRISASLDSQYRRTRVSGGELLISLVGTIGRAVLLPNDLGAANIHRNLGLLRLSDGMSPTFWLLYLRSHLAQRQIASTTYGTTQALLNLGNIRSLIVPVVPVAEQERIALAGASITELIASEQSEFEKLRTIRRGLTDDLLTGRLRTLPTEAT